MNSAPTDPNEALRAALSGAKNVKLGSGVVGKTGHIMWGLLAMWILIACRISSDVVFDLVIVSVGLFVTIFIAWFILRTFQFAEKNPAQAMLEGAEFLEYHKLEVQAKGIPASSGNLVEQIRPVHDGLGELK